MQTPHKKKHTRHVDQNITPVITEQTFWSGSARRQAACQYSDEILHCHLQHRGRMVYNNISRIIFLLNIIKWGSYLIASVIDLYVIAIDIDVLVCIVEHSCWNVKHTKSGLITRGASFHTRWC